MRLPEDNETRHATVNILPMIDVIFAILTFFIMSTLYLTKEEGLPVNLPQAANVTSQEQAEVTLTITSDGEVFLGKSAIALSDLAQEMRKTASEGPVQVTIRADEATAHGKVVAVMDQLRQVEGVKMGIATTQP
jgi:biopolymer transport protein ExbD